MAIYLNSALEYLRTGTPYDFATDRGLGFTYPPAALGIFLPLTDLSLGVVWTAWVILIGGLGAAMTLWVIRRSGAAPDPLVGLLLGALVAFTDPINDSMWLGQLSPFVGATAFLALSGPRASDGLWAGLGGAIKITPMADVLGFALRPDRRGRTAWACGGALALTLTGFLIAPDASLYYWTQGLFDTSRVGRIGSGSNTSLPGLLAHAGLPDLGAQALGIGLVIIGGVLWLRFVHLRRDVALLDLAVAVGSAVVLITPVSWGHHGLAISLGWLLLALRRRWVPAIAGATCWSLPLFVWANEVPQLWKLPVQSLRPLSIVLLVVALAATCPRRLPAGDGGSQHHGEGNALDTPADRHRELVLVGAVTGSDPQPAPGNSPPPGNR